MVAAREAQGLENVSEKPTARKWRLYPTRLGPYPRMTPVHCHEAVLATSVAERALARSAERAVDDHFAQCALEDRELLIIELRDEQLRDTARVDRRGLC
jgi:hypothetical protein